MNAATLEVPTLPANGLAQAPPRWLQVVTHLDPKYGGLSAAVPALGRSLREHEQLSIALSAFCAPQEHVVPAGFAAHEIAFWPASRMPWLADPLHGRRLRRDFAAHLHGIEGLHLHGLWEESTGTAARAARAAGLPYVLSAHGMLEPWALAGKRLKKVVYSALIERRNVTGAACLHALTHAEAEQYRAFGARGPIAVIPNAVEAPQDADASLFLDHFPAVRGKRLVVYLGRLHAKKGLDLLLAAWTQLAVRYPQAHLVLAGPDADGTAARLARQVAAHRLQASVSFTGMLDSAMKWSALAAAELFVLPSHSEGLSVSVLEAMALAKPVILTHACNLPQVQEARAGWLIDTTLDALTASLSEALSNTSAQNDFIGRRGAALIEAHYTWPTVARQMAEVYRWVAGGPLPASVDILFAERAA